MHSPSYHTMELNIIAITAEHLAINRERINILVSFNIFVPKFICVYIDTIVPVYFKFKQFL